jgi:hypothetical protein
MFGSRIALLGLLGCAVLLVVIVELVRNNRLELKYSLLWLLTGTALIFVGLQPQLLERLARLLGIQVPANALFVLGLVFLIWIILYLTVAISHLMRRTRILAQQLALLRQRLDAQSPPPAELDGSHGRPEQPTTPPV